MQYLDWVYLFFFSVNFHKFLRSVTFLKLFRSFLDLKIEVSFHFKSLYVVFSVKSNDCELSIPVANVVSDLFWSCLFLATI